MTAGRAAVATTVLLLVGATLVSGPLVGISLTDDPTAAGPSTANVTVETVPQTAELSPDRHGADHYHLRADSLRATATDVSGQPTVMYRIAIPALDHSRSSTTFLTESGVYDLGFESSSIDADRIDADRYDGTLTVQLYEDDGETTLVETDIVVEVADD